MRKAARKLGLITTISITALVFSVGTSTSAAPTQNDFEALGTAPGNETSSSSLTAEVNVAEENESGNLLAVTWSIENSGSEPVVLTWLTDLSYTYSGGAYFSGVTAFSPENGTRYHPIMDGEGECLCAGNVSNDFEQRVDSEEKMTYWSMYSVPSDLETISVEIPGFDPIEDIPIS
ncbi:hypothetical protein [Nocardiopsis alborubida]|uniref:hypothetical protein n=1 Tax=Nocardiopsis alborubida TaxID=146802 RepID=UPI001E651DB4|nr:hypothetical protein [Nocardiopsis alborubida]